MIPYRFSLPGPWEALDLNPRTDLANIAALLDRRLLGQVPAADRRRLLTALHRGVRAAAGAGATHASLFAEAVGEEVVGASLFVSVVSSHDVLGDDGIDLAAIVAGLGPALEPVCHGGPPEVTAIDLPAGPAVRARFLTSAEAMGRRLVCRDVQYHVPTPDQARILVFQFSTPSLPVDEAFCDLFAAIVESLEWDETVGPAA